MAIGLGFFENYVDIMFNTEIGPTFTGLENIKNALVNKDAAKEKKAIKAAQKALAANKS